MTHSGRTKSLLYAQNNLSLTHKKGHDMNIVSFFGVNCYEQSNLYVHQPFTARQWQSFQPITQGAQAQIRRKHEQAA